MSKDQTKKGLGPRSHGDLLETLRARFEGNKHRHDGLTWEKVRARLEARSDKLRSLGELENTGGEPDVVDYDRKTGEYLFQDCSAESPAGRRSLCYDRTALDARKENKPKGNAVELAAAMGAALLTEEQYRRLQALGPCDTKTSSWLLTPPDIRTRGGAIFGDYRYGTVFVYHNGADSYYAARGFRCSLRV
jgi:Protein of unknown function (DUF4256)